MRFGTIFSIIVLGAFIAATVYGYQQYIKGMRGQAKGLGVGAARLENYRSSLDKLGKRQDSSAATAEGASKRAEEMMRKIRELQNKK